MSSTEEDQDKTPPAKCIFVNYVDSYQGKNFAKVCVITAVSYRGNVTVVTDQKIMLMAHSQESGTRNLRSFLYKKRVKF